MDEQGVSIFFKCCDFKKIKITTLFPHPGQHQKVLLTEREKTIETMRRDNERLQQSIKGTQLGVSTSTNSVDNTQLTCTINVYNKSE